MSRPTWPRKVISGGQTGVDQGALRAAQAAGLVTGGWCPPGRASESGPIPGQFPLTETPKERSERAPEVPRSQRTEWNVRDSDATLILQPASPQAADPGTAFTAECARRYQRPLLSCDPDEARAAERISRWITAQQVATLHVAGPSEATCPGVGDATYHLLSTLFKMPEPSAGRSAPTS